MTQPLNKGEGTGGEFSGYHYPQPKWTLPYPQDPNSDQKLWQPNWRRPLNAEYKKERKKSVSPATVNRELACLKHMLTKAVVWEMIERNPAKKVRLLTENNERLRYLTFEEVESL